MSRCHNLYRLPPSPLSCKREVQRRILTITLYRADSYNVKKRCTHIAYTFSSTIPIPHYQPKSSVLPVSASVFKLLRIIGQLCFVFS